MTQITKPSRILLIDGNNLAHFLYPDLNPGKKMTPVHSLRLINHLNNYARQFGQSVKIELCLDRSPGDPGSLHESMRVLWAHYPKDGDDLLIDRFWFHHVSHHACLVITNDEDILDEVNSAGGASLRIFEFVRRPGLNSPVFREPVDLPQVYFNSPDIDEPVQGLPLSASIYFRLVEDPRLNKLGRSPGLPQDTNSPNLSPPSQSAFYNPELGLLSPDQIQYREESDIQVKELDEDSLPVTLPEKTEELSFIGQAEEPHYFLDLDHWPPEEGIRFLARSFCPSHRAEFKDLIDLANSEKSTADNLRALAELLLYSCSHEDNFARRGSLMTRVRLALLQARGEPLSLSGLAEATGLKRHGLQGRINAKAGRWVAIIS